jgi:hypothetical protein
MDEVEAAARRCWAWERDDVQRRWGVVLPPWEELSATNQRRQIEMVDPRLWNGPKVYREER